MHATAAAALLCSIAEDSQTRVNPINNHFQNQGLVFVICWALLLGQGTTLTVQEIVSPAVPAPERNQGNVGSFGHGPGCSFERAQFGA